MKKDMIHAENADHKECNEQIKKRVRKLKKKILDKFCIPKYTKQVACWSRARYRGLVKWYDRGLQNLWWEFDSLIPCY